MSKRMLADVLWEAANSRLWDGQSTQWYGSTYSCHAVYDEVCNGPMWDSNIRPVRRFLASLGCDVENACFEDYDCGRASQGVRYMWLLLAMHVAEDEGITV